jgi:hypothetical protein
MISFAAKLRDGQRFLGLGLSDVDLLSLKSGKPVVLDLASCGVGLWVKEADGSRTFLQPRDSNVLLMAADSTEDIGALLKVDMSTLKKGG